MAKNQLVFSSNGVNIMGVIEKLRQLAYPREFRIAPPVWSSEMLLIFEKLLENISTIDRSANDEIQTRFLADISNDLWRLKHKMLQPGSDQPLEELRRAYRHLESAWNALTRLGVKILDHTGEPFDSGYSISVLAFQPMTDIEREIVIETIKPTIYFDEQRIQMGQVIVGTPDKSDAQLEV